MQKVTRKRERKLREIDGSMHSSLTENFAKKAKEAPKQVAGKAPVYVHLKVENVFTIHSTARILKSQVESSRCSSSRILLSSTARELRRFAAMHEPSL